MWQSPLYIYTFFFSLSYLLISFFYFFSSSFGFLKASGAYIFRPDGTYPIEYEGTVNNSFTNAEF